MEGKSQTASFSSSVAALMSAIVGCSGTGGRSKPGRAVSGWGLGPLVIQRALVQIPRLRAADAPARRPNTAPETSPAPLG